VLLDFLFEVLRKFPIILQEPVSNERPKRTALQREVCCAQYYGRTRKLLETESKDRSCLGVLHEGIRMVVVVVYRRLCLTVRVRESSLYPFSIEDGVI
jgi:hypothetical protein